MSRFIVHLSQEIQIRSNPESSSTYKDSAYFRNTFPYFFWLLRDVLLSIPKEYRDITDYFLRKAIIGNVFFTQFLSAKRKKIIIIMRLGFTLAIKFKMTFIR